jgi:ketosteroid isomerase-like protein
MTTSTTTNAQALREGYDAFARGDIPAVLAIFDEDIAWHIPGRSPLSGDYRGHQEVVGFLMRAHELSGGTLRVQLDDVLADGDTLVALTTVSAERGGRSWSSPEIHVWRFADGRAVEMREYQGDQQTEDEFWSS